jgi:hypothetical protein
MKFKLNLPKSPLTESTQERFKAAADAYRKATNVEDGVTLTEDMINENALCEICTKHNCAAGDVRNVLLEKDVTIDAAAREEEGNATIVKEKSRIEAALDKSLKKAKTYQSRGTRRKSDFPNVYIVGPAGFGKTEIVMQWAEENGINLVRKDASSMDATDFGGLKVRDNQDGKYAMRIGTKEFEQLKKPNSVLFLDEFNRARADVRGTLLTLIQNHLVWNPYNEGEVEFLENFLFTVVAMNPNNSSYSGTNKMDNAEITRGRMLFVSPNPQEHLNYLERHYASEMENATDEEDKMELAGRIGIATALLTDPEFKYDVDKDEEEHEDEDMFRPLTYRTLKLALDDCDGTKADFLDIWPDFINRDKLPMAERILNNYVDVKDKANSVFQDEEDEEEDENIFSGDDDLATKVLDRLSQLGL